MEVVTDVKCPFCGLPVTPFDSTQEHGIPLYGCTNPDCEESEDLVGTIEMWCHLVIVSDEMKNCRKALLNLPIRKGGFIDGYALSALNKLGVKKVGDLIKITQMDLLKTPGCGRKTLWCIKCFLEEFGLSLATEDSK